MSEERAVSLRETGDGWRLCFRGMESGWKVSLNTQYASPNPLNFGVGHDDFRIGTLPVAAPEIVLHEGQCHIAAWEPSLKGIRVAKLKWVP